MIINSPFRDYYDSSIGFGIDNTVVFNRTRRELDCNAKQGPDAQVVADIDKAVQRFQMLKGDMTRRSHKVSSIYIGFCGKVYQGLVSCIDLNTGEMNDVQRQSLATVARFMWSLKDVPDTLSKVPLVDRYTYQGAINTLKDWFDDEHVRCFEDVDLFVKHKMVSFMYCEGDAAINPCLKQYEFQRQIGAVEAFQEISMFISGVLGAPSSPMIELQDKDRIVAHGFDAHSFRQAEHPRKSRKD
jgi:hypothetical protein